jgi:hypothetical protein
MNAFGASPAATTDARQKKRISGRMEIPFGACSGDKQVVFVWKPDVRGHDSHGTFREIASEGR